MKILYITTVSSTINAFLIPHIEMLINNKNKVDCAAAMDVEISDILKNKNVKFFNMPFKRMPLKVSNFIAFKNLLKIQKKYKYDVIHVHTPIASIFGRLLKVFYPKLKIIYTAHGYHFYKGAPKKSWILYYPIEKIMAKLTDVTITINKEDYEITKKKLKPKKCYLVNGVGLDLNKYKQLSKQEKENKRKELQISEDSFIVIMIAELNFNKNQIQLIKAMELLKDKYPNIKTLLVGSGPMEKLIKNEINNRNLGDNVKLLGFRKDVNELINISDIGVLLSFREGLPRNIMELMANGKKVIATNIRGCKDLVSNKEIGELVNVGDYKRTAELIEKFYFDNPMISVRNEIRNYDINFIVSKLYEIYSDLLV
ncbi:glycosyltransferase family 4 protein [Clostridium perfringens]|uniref:glycosyltransferase family 4 protein n=1 Tax=Clostridium perfringens TaxID=1502 RepID=UPI0028E10635|nr:glycosyltransferase family 4 protein [Clostridium perfringens]MDT9337256.1 glycosyltransferase family 4 protein [Clostridium perfringens]MDT9345012.1 glycosyltransferase family 4 protein [Clostridium perfringens]MDT9348244.1 glycosyltransferase family 4 protein [Clostridium perfringens]MDT9354099.1 glycosyltransferase family 4 protein [Clostridium perfringens]